MYVLLTVKLVTLKKEKYDPVLALKRTEWSKFMDYFGQSIEADPSRVGKKNIYIFHIGCIPRPSSAKLRISRCHLYE